MPSVFELTEKSQPSCQKEERFTVQNKLTDASPIREQSRKARLPMRHKPLYAMKNGQDYKTSVRSEANNEPIAVKLLLTMRYIQITKRGLS